MGSGTRSLAVEKKLIKECVTDILKDEQFLSELVQKLAGKVEALVDRKLEQLEIKVQGLEETNKQLIHKIEVLERENLRKNDSLDAMEQYSRRNTVRFLAVPCTGDRGEEIENSLLEVINKSVKLKLLPDHIDRCHPLGPARDGKRDVLMKFTSYRYRQNVLVNRKSLHESGLNVVEDLTRDRYRLLKAAKSGLGGRNVWTFDGSVNCRIEGKKYVLKTHDDLKTLLDAT